MSRAERLAFVATAISVVAGLLSAWAVIGEVASRPLVITLFFSGFGAGAGVAVWVAQRRLTARRPG